MNRREWILGSAMLAVGVFAKDLFAWQDNPIDFGWAPDHHSNLPRFSQFGQQPIAEGQGKVVRLWNCLELAQQEPYVNYVQTAGTCVGQAASLGATTLDAIQQTIQGRGSWRGHYAAEPIYAGSKVEIAWDQDLVCKCRRHGWQWKRWQGTTCEFAVRWMMQYGLCLRGKYGDIDLSKNNCYLAVQWSNRDSGVPKIIEDASKNTPLLLAVKIDGGWEQASYAVSQGYPVLMGSNQGYKTKRNKDGLLETGGIWKHSTLLWGVDTKSSTQAGCIANSWRKEWISGPQYKYPAPPSGFWTEAKNVDSMLREGHSYALSDLHGYPARITDYSIF